MASAEGISTFRFVPFQPSSLVLPSLSLSRAVFPSLRRFHNSRPPALSLFLFSFSHFLSFSLILSLSLSFSVSLSPSFQLLPEEPASRSPQRSRFPRSELPSSYRRRRRRLPSSSSRYFSSSFSSSARAFRGSGDRYGPIYFRSRRWSHVYERKGASAALCSLSLSPSLSLPLSLSPPSLPPLSLSRLCVETFDFYDTRRASSRAHRCSSFVPRIGHLVLRPHLIAETLPPGSDFFSFSFLRSPGSN